MVQACAIDPSVLVQGYIQDTQTPYAQALLKKLTDAVPVILHTPEFCLLEYTNILWKQVRFHGASMQNVNHALARLEKTPLTIHPAISLLPRALKLGLDYELAIYDSIYIALSEKLNLPLITVDARQSTAAQKSGITIKAVTDFPLIT